MVLKGQSYQCMEFSELLALVAWMVPFPYNFLLCVRQIKQAVISLMGNSNAETAELEGEICLLSLSTSRYNFRSRRY